MTATIIPFPNGKKVTSASSELARQREVVATMLVERARKIGIDRSLEDAKQALLSAPPVTEAHFGRLDLDVEAERLASMICDRAMRNGKPCTMAKARDAVWQALEEMKGA